MSTTNVPCVYVLVRKGDKLAFVLRERTGFLDGTYSLPAGRVEDGENFREAAVREAREEIDVRIRLDDLKHIFTMHCRRGDNICADVFFEATTWSGEAKNNEPERHSAFDWLPEASLPYKDIMYFQAHALQQIAQGESYSELGWPE